MASFKIDESVFDKLAEILKRHNLSEVEYKDGDSKIRISSVSNIPYSPVVSSPPVSLNNTITQDVAEVSSSESNFKDHKGAVKSPMVGTCYNAPEPGAQNFITVGDSVQEGQPILIIEAMKVMNLIKAPKAGKVIHIAVSDGAPVEYGQLLVVIE